MNVTPSTDHVRQVGAYYLVACAGFTHSDFGYNIQRSRVHLAINTMMELNEAFYLRHGWKTTRRYEHQPGSDYVRNSVLITAVQMEKVIEVNE